MDTRESRIGVIGLSVMGGNLAMNIADNGFSVSVYNRSRERTDTLITSYGTDASMRPFYDLKSFVESLEKPRKIILMVQAGQAVDDVLDLLTPLLDQGDIVIDAGNSFFKDTIRRAVSLREQGISFVGMGVSGGEEGARTGPSIMPGGDRQSWIELQPILEKIAARDFNRKPCVSHIGEDGAGHYVKMVHNAIEYVDMQLIAEAYFIMKEGLSLSNENIARMFSEWNGGRLNSFLIEITATILRTKNDEGAYVLDTILDSAGSKGTGKWTSEEALELGTPSFGIVAAVLARYASAHKKRRLGLSKLYPSDMPVTVDISISEIESALYVSKILAYAQGYDLLTEAADRYGWQLDQSEISRIWQGGCIIRAKFLETLAQEFGTEEASRGILELPYFINTIRAEQGNLRKVSAASIAARIAIPAMLSGLSYFDTMTTDTLPANLIQAQRDFFGAHTFQTEVDGPFSHFEWNA